MATLAEDARAFRALKLREREEKATYEATKEERVTAERRLIDRMEAEETESLRVDGVLFSPTHTRFGQVQDRAAFIAWVEEHGDRELLEVRERPLLINELVRELDDNEEEFPPGLGMYTRDYIGQTSA